MNIPSNIFTDKILKHVLGDKTSKHVKSCLQKLDHIDDETKIINIINTTSMLKETCFSVDDAYIKNDNVYKDIEFFSTQSEKATSVFSNIHNCSTYGGKYFSEQIYKNPTSNIDILNKRTHYLKTIETQYKHHFKETNDLLKVLKDNEKHIIWLLEEKDETIKDLYSMVFFRLKGLQPLNNIGSALTSYNIYRIIVSPLFGIVAPIIYFLIPYIIVLYKFKVRIPFTTYMKTMVSSVFTGSDTLFGNNKFFKYMRIISYVFSAMFYFQGIFTSIDVSKTVNKMCGLIISNFNSIIDYLVASKRLIELYWNSNDCSSYINNNINIEGNNDDTLIETLKKVKKDYNIFHNFGDQLKAYKYLDIEGLTRILRKSYVLDSLIGAIKLKTSRNFCISKYINEGKPTINFTGVVHPSIICEKAVKNDVRFGVIDNEQNAIITSPNSSGKSILIKSIIVNVIMSQTMGICCSISSIITPFTYITTQINVPDSTGHESLFEAEMFRCKNTLDKLKCLHGRESESKGYSLVVMDEIFNSTNPIEGVAGAYAVCKKITSFQSNILIFTTHLGYLTKLAKDKDTCKFVNYRMETQYNEKNHSIVFTYKLERGVNKHLLALELLKKTGFEDDIIDEAIEIKNRLCKRK
jgi:DNA mismatch repair ATPase MutS